MNHEDINLEYVENVKKAIDEVTAGDKQYFKYQQIKERVNYPRNVICISLNKLAREGYIKKHSKRYWKVQK